KIMGRTKAARRSGKEEVNRNHAAAEHVKRASIHPGAAGDPLGMRPPDVDATRRQSRYATLALPPRLEIAMPQETVHVLGDVERANVEKDQAVVSARKLLAEEIPVAADERWMSNLLKQRQDFVVLHSFTADIAADLTEVNSPGTQPRSLTLEDVLIEHDQAETGLSRYSS